jgi:hypothetical protein
MKTLRVRRESETGCSDMRFPSTSQRVTNTGDRRPRRRIRAPGSRVRVERTGAAELNRRGDWSSTERSTVSRSLSKSERPPARAPSPRVRARGSSNVRGDVVRSALDARISRDPAPPSSRRPRREIGQPARYSAPSGTSPCSSFRRSRANALCHPSVRRQPILRKPPRARGARGSGESASN